MFLGDWPDPILREVVDDEVGLPREPRGGVAIGAGAGLDDEVGERRGEAVEGLPEWLKPVAGDVVGGLGTVGEALDARERERHEVDGPGVAPRWEAREVARRGDEGHAVAPRRQALGELQEWEQVAER